MNNNWQKLNNFGFVPECEFPQKDPTPRTAHSLFSPQNTHLKRDPVKKSSGHSFGLGVGNDET